MMRLFSLALALVVAGCSDRQRSRSGLPDQLDVPPQMDSLIVQNEKHARALAKQLDLKVAEEIWNYFRAGRSGNHSAMVRIFQALRGRAGQYDGSTNDPAVGTPVWQLVLEVQLALESYTNGVPKWPTAFGTEIVKSVPRGSIYFGGTDPGRGLPTAFSKSHTEADPFFTLTQNSLADGHYLEYLRYLYGGKIQIPTADDSQHCFQAYLTEAQKRLQHDRDFPDEPRQIRPGESVEVVNNHVQVSGQVSVMAINALLAKIIFDNNPKREFYIQESFPLDWMYPHLAPHGFIFKIHREPLSTVSPELVAKDREFWTQQQAGMIGDWLTPDTPVKAVCDFVDKIYLKQNLAGFAGDPTFVRSEFATKLYSKLRRSIGGLYNWRIANSKTSEEQQRMSKEADFAFRQAFALCPFSPEAIFCYVNLLVQLQRLEDALLVAHAGLRLNPKDSQLQDLITELERIRSAQPK